MDRYRTNDYSTLSSSAHGAIATHLKEWISYYLSPGNTVPGLIESSGRFGFKVDQIVGVNITNGDTDRDNFEAHLLISTEQVTIAGVVGDRIVYAYGDVTAELRKRSPLTLYHLDSNKIALFEEYQLIEL